MSVRPIGRPKKYAEYEMLLSELPKVMQKRPRYVNGIGVFRGAKSETAWVKIRLPNGGVLKGRAYGKGDAAEIKVGNLSSWSWKDLEGKRDELQGRADRSEPLEEEAPLLFSEHSTNWLERLKQRTRGYKTAEIHVDAHLLSVFGKKTVDIIRVQDINGYIKDRLDKAKPATVKREIDTLNAILNDAVKSGRLKANPGAFADKIKGIMPRQRFLDTKEIIDLLAEAVAVADWLPDFIIWCLHSGMRRGEVLQLKWSDVRVLANGRTIVQIGRSKNDQPRTVVCTSSMIEILDRQKDRKVKDDERVFPVAKITLRRKWEKARINAKLGDVTIHDLRRTHSTQAAVAGVDLRTLAGRLGHSNLSMLERHYAALVGTASEEAAAKIERAFSSKQVSPPRESQRAR